MTKSQAIKLFGSGKALADAIGRTRSAISQWPQELTQRQADLVTGAAIRLGRLPCSDISHASAISLARKPKSRTQ